MTDTDVPSPINLCHMDDAREWERTAMDRPYRLDFFGAFAIELANIGKPSLNVLELGAGPGFLARHLLDRLPGLTMTLLDFSPPMHTLARQRLAGYLERITLLERDFKRSGWETGLGTFDAVITLQAVHELRHKRYAPALHAAVRGLLAEGGVYLMGDHYCGEDGMRDNQLYMTREEHRQCLVDAGFAVSVVLEKGGRVLYRAC